MYIAYTSYMIYEEDKIKVFNHITNLNFFVLHRTSCIFFNRRK